MARDVLEGGVDPLLVADEREAEGGRRGAMNLGLSRAVAVLSLTAATPEEDTPEEVAKGKVTLRAHHAPARRRR